MVMDKVRDSFDGGLEQFLCFTTENLFRVFICVCIVYVYLYICLVLVHSVGTRPRILKTQDICLYHYCYYYHYCCSSSSFCVCCYCY